jgi:hypothetical protein
MTSWTKEGTISHVCESETPTEQKKEGNVNLCKISLHEPVQQTSLLSPRFSNYYRFSNDWAIFDAVLMIIRS